MHGAWCIGEHDQTSAYPSPTVLRSNCTKELEPSCHGLRAPRSVGGASLTPITGHRRRLSLRNQISVRRTKTVSGAQRRDCRAVVLRFEHTGAGDKDRGPGIDQIAGIALTHTTVNLDIDGPLADH